METTNFNELEPAQKQRSPIINVLILLGIAILIFAWFNLNREMDEIQGSAWESMAKGVLYSISQSQETYKASRNGVYGTFEDLQIAGQLPAGTSLDTLIEHYRLTWDIDNNSATYRIIAYPNDSLRDSLSTFGISEDGAVRVYTPEHGNDLNNVKSWDSAF